MEFLKKHYRLLTLSFLIGVLLPSAMGMNLSANLSSDNVFRDMNKMDEVIIKYHLYVNDYVNQFLERSVSDEVQGVETTAYVDPEDCSTENVSTYCLAVLLNEVLVDFEEKLRSMEDSFDPETLTGDNSDQVEEALRQTLANKGRIQDEIEAARESLDLTLAVYNQVQTVYPVHKELTDMITNLEQYRDNLAGVRSQLELYPSRFNNATTAFCK